MTYAAEDHPPRTHEHRPDPDRDAGRPDPDCEWHKTATIGHVQSRQKVTARSLEALLKKEPPKSNWLPEKLARRVLEEGRAVCGHIGWSDIHPSHTGSPVYVRRLPGRSYEACTDGYDTLPALGPFWTDLSRDDADYIGGVPFDSEGFRPDAQNPMETPHDFLVNGYQPVQLDDGNRFYVDLRYPPRSETLSVSPLKRVYAVHGRKKQLKQVNDPRVIHALETLLGVDKRQRLVLTTYLERGDIWDGRRIGTLGLTHREVTPSLHPIEAFVRWISLTAYRIHAHPSEQQISLKINANFVEDIMLQLLERLATLLGGGKIATGQSAILLSDIPNGPEFLTAFLATLKGAPLQMWRMAAEFPTNDVNALLETLQGMDGKKRTAAISYVAPSSQYGRGEPVATIGLQR